MPVSDGREVQNVCSELYGQLQAKEKQMQEYQAKHNIRLRNQVFHRVQTWRIQMCSCRLFT